LLGWAAQFSDLFGKSRPVLRSTATRHNTGPAENPDTRRDSLGVSACAPALTGLKGIRTTTNRERLVATVGVRRVFTNRPTTPRYRVGLQENWLTHWYSLHNDEVTVPKGRYTVNTGNLREGPTRNIRRNATVFYRTLLRLHQISLHGHVDRYFAMRSRQGRRSGTRPPISAAPSRPCPRSITQRSQR
jgi:hypothetical protein